MSSYIYIYRFWRFNTYFWSSNWPIFKICFDSENLRTWYRYDVAIPLILVNIDPLNSYQIFLVLLAFFTVEISKKERYFHTSFLWDFQKCSRKLWTPRNKDVPSNLWQCWKSVNQKKIWLRYAILIFYFSESKGIFENRKNRIMRFGVRARGQSLKSSQPGI